VFHICQSGGQMDSFLCPNGTIFNQRYLVCDWYYNVDCSQAEGLWRETNEAVVNAMREADERLALEKQQQQAGGYDSNAQSNDRRGGSNGNGGYQYESPNGQRGQSGNAPSASVGAPNGNGASSFGNRNSNGAAPSQTYGAPNGNSNSRNGNGNSNSRNSNGNNRNGNGGSANVANGISTQNGAPTAGSRNGNRQSSNGNVANGNGYSNGPSSNSRAGSTPSSQYGAPNNGNGNGMHIVVLKPKYYLRLVMPFQVSPMAMVSLPTTALDPPLAPNMELPPTAMATHAMVSDKYQPTAMHDQLNHRCR
jgi:Chitin binding Peritrophin-A domain